MRMKRENSKTSLREKLSEKILKGTLSLSWQLNNRICVYIQGAMQKTIDNLTSWNQCHWQWLGPVSFQKQPQKTGYCWHILFQTDNLQSFFYP